MTTRSGTTMVRNTKRRDHLPAQARNFSHSFEIEGDGARAWKHRKAKQPTPKIISYQECVKTHQNSDQPFIIDMREPAFSTKTEIDEASPPKIPFEKEIVHFVTFMLNSHENMLLPKYLLVQPYRYSQMFASSPPLVVAKEYSSKSKVASCY